MSEIYTFTGRVVGRLTNRIKIIPEDRDAFLDYLERAGLSVTAYRDGQEYRVWVSNPKMIAASKGAERIKYSVQRRGGARMFGLSLESL